MIESTRAQSGEDNAPASPDPWHGNFAAENFLFVFPIALFIVFAVFAALLGSPS